jgi:hypothetical protein
MKRNDTMSKHKQKHSTKSLELKCSFCGKYESDVGDIIAGPSVYICDECVYLCRDIIRDERHDLEEIKEDAKENKNENLAYETERFMNNFFGLDYSKDMEQELDDSALEPHGRLIVDIGIPITRDEIEEITWTQSVTFKLRK